MPLFHKKSKKAFSHNIKEEMEAGKPQKQAVAIAYSVKRRAKKASGGKVESGSPDMNYAKGGAVSAKSEKRPMPDQVFNDAKSARMNSGDKPAKDDRMTDQPERKQSMKGGVYALKEPSIVQGATFKAKRRDRMDELLRDNERHIQDSMRPDGYGKQPSAEDDESRPDRQGPSVPSMKMKKMAQGGQIIDEDDLQDLDPSEDEGDMFAEEHDEEGQDRQGRAPHKMKMMAEGGPTDIDKDTKDMEDEMRHIEDPKSPQEDVDPDLAEMAQGGSVDDSEDQPEPEEEDEHHASLAAAIMAKRRMMAEGGQVDLSLNADEEPNNEDQMSFEALKKENYDESSALDETHHPEDSNMKSPEHDEINVHANALVSAIRRKMKMKSDITK